MANGHEYQTIMKGLNRLEKELGAMGGIGETNRLLHQILDLLAPKREDFVLHNIRWSMDPDEIAKDLKAVLVGEAVTHLPYLGTEDPPDNPVRIAVHEGFDRNSVGISVSNYTTMVFEQRRRTDGGCIWLRTA